MPAFEIKMDNGLIDTVLCAENENDAIQRHADERIRMGYEITNVTEVRRMNESYGGGGYWLVAIEAFHSVENMQQH